MIAPQPDGPADDRTAFNTRHDVFNADPTTRNLLIVRFLYRGERSTFRFFMRHCDDAVWHGKAKKAQILQEFTVRWELKGRSIGQPLVVHTAFNGVTQKLHAGRGIRQHHIFHRVRVLLAAEVVRLFTRVRGARDGSLDAIEKKGVGAGNGGATGSDSVGMSRPRLV